MSFSGMGCDMVDRCVNDCNDRGVCRDGVCMCNTGWTGDDCSSEGEGENTAPPDCSAFGSCSSHGNCVWDQELKRAKCECSGNWAGVDCALEVLGRIRPLENPHAECDDVVANNCVTMWINAVSPNCVQ
jgi:hypothetical protein